MGEEDLTETYQEASGKAKKDLVAVKRKTLAAKDKLLGRLRAYRKELGRQSE